MSLKKILLLPISLMMSAAGCAGIGPNATYYMGTTSFQYFTSYHAYMTELNGEEIGGGFGGGMNTSPVKIGSKVITWGETNSKRKHVEESNCSYKRTIKREKYLAVHIYPDETVEITTSNDWPKPTEKDSNY